MITLTTIPNELVSMKSVYDILVCLYSNAEYLFYLVHVLRQHRRICGIDKGNDREGGG